MKEKQILKELHAARKRMEKEFHYTDIPVENFEIDDIRMEYFMVCLEPKSVPYGKGIGAFTYKDGRVFQFCYNIHTPEAKGPRLSNQMTNIQQLELSEIRTDIFMLRPVDTDFGNMAFWDHTPLSTLTGESKTLRLLMKSLQAYCRKENYCEQLQKLDLAHLEWETERNAATVMMNSMYGVSQSEGMRWCKKQMEDTEKRLICAAHLAEGRAFECPYKNADEREKADYPCTDYKRIAEV